VSGAGPEAIVFLIRDRVGFSTGCAHERRDIAPWPSRPGWSALGPRPCVLRVLRTPYLSRMSEFATSLLLTQRSINSDLCMISTAVAQGRRSARLQIKITPSFYPLLMQRRRCRMYTSCLTIFLGLHNLDESMARCAIGS
jgi:hypothetical protein